MSTAIYHIGDTRDITATLDDNSIDLILTSPPFLALRSYLPEGHESKHREIGSEATPAEFVDVLLGLAAEWRRVLAPHGSIAVELGDTYSGSTQVADRGSPENWADPLWKPTTQDAYQESGDGWPLAKSLALIPELFRIGLVYGHNPLTGEPSPAGQWRARNVVRWVRPNPPVGALGDKYRPATSEMVIACVSARRWFDLDAVRTATSTAGKDYRPGRTPMPDNRNPSTGWDYEYRPGGKENPAGAPPLDWWTIPTAPYKGAHYATWPPELCRIPIESMCPRHVCRTCGQPRRRLVDHDRQLHADQPASNDERQMAAHGKSLDNFASAQGGRGYTVTRETTGWSDCDHDDFRAGVVFDPFAGSGTTLAVATGHGRDAIGIDIDPRNADLARERVGMFLTVNDKKRDGGPDQLQPRPPTGSVQHDPNPPW